MPNDMAERIARIMWKHFATEGAFDEDRNDEDRGAYLTAARAAIEAMREPTDAMLRSINAQVLVAGTDSGCYSDHNPSPDVAWETMIDAALKE